MPRYKLRKLIRIVNIKIAEIEKYKDLRYL